MGAISSTPSNDARESGNRLEPKLVGKLLHSLHPVELIRLECACRSFSTGVYTGQHEFHWNRHHRQYLIDQLHLSSVGSDHFDETAFVSAVAAKVGPSTRSLRLSMARLPPPRVLQLFPHVSQVWLQLTEDSVELQQLWAEPTLLHRRSLRELKVMVGGDDPLRLSTSALSRFLKHFDSSLHSLALWKAETLLEHRILKMSALRSLTLYCDDQSISFLSNLSKQQAEAATLRSLTIKWHTDRLERTENFSKFLCALGRFPPLDSLNLQVNWSSVVVTSDRREEQMMLNQWIGYMNSRGTKRVRRLSLDCQFGSPKPESYITAATMVHTFTYGIDHLRVLRLEASDAAIFPLRIGAARVDTLELVFKSGPETLNFQSRDIYIFKELRNEHAVRSLRLANCPVTFDGKLVDHLIRWFPDLEQLYFQAARQELYTDQLDREVNTLIRAMPRLRVVHFEDQFARPQLTASIWALLARATRSPGKTFKLVTNVQRYRVSKLAQVQLYLRIVTNFRLH